MSNSKKPTHNVYQNIPNSKKKNQLGVAWAHSEGGGFNISLNSMPFDGNLVVFPVKEGDQTTEGK